MTQKGELGLTAPQGDSEAGSGPRFRDSFPVHLLSGPLQKPPGWHLKSSTQHPNPAGPALEQPQSTPPAFGGPARAGSSVSSLRAGSPAATSTYLVYQPRAGTERRPGARRRLTAGRPGPAGLAPRGCRQRPAPALGAALKCNSASDLSERPARGSGPGGTDALAPRPARLPGCPTL